MQDGTNCQFIMIHMFMIQGFIFRLIRRIYHLVRADRVFSFFSQIKTVLAIPLIRKNYENVISRLRMDARKRKLRVLFLVNDSSKWKAQSVYDALASDGYDVEIAISLYGWNDDLRKAEVEAEKTYLFFERCGMSVSYAYSFETHSPIPLSVFRIIKISKLF